MAKKETTSPAIPVFPMLKTVEQMSKISGIGENKLRELMDSGELEYIQNGNRRLLADTAIWDWYERAKRKVTAVQVVIDLGTVIAVHCSRGIIQRRQQICFDISDLRRVLVDTVKDIL